VRLPKEHWFYQKEPNDIYWFSVVAVYNKTVPNYDWGWTNHEHVYQDDAVEGFWDLSGPLPIWKWKELLDQLHQTEDMSFMLFTEECLNHTAPGYTNWLYWNRPDCWCYARQCRGDADGRLQGPFWVSLNDLILFRKAVSKLEPQLRLVPNGICADFDHKQLGPFWVSLNDLIIFRQYVSKMAFMIPLCDQPPIITGPYNFWTSP